MIKSDRELWTWKPTNNVQALNQTFKALTTDPRVSLYLLPLPSSGVKCANCHKAGHSLERPSMEGDVSPRQTQRRIHGCFGTCDPPSGEAGGQKGVQSLP